MSMERFQPEPSTNGLLTFRLTSGLVESIDNGVDVLKRQLTYHLSDIVLNLA